MGPCKQNHGEHKHGSSCASMPLNTWPEYQTSYILHMRLWHIPPDYIEVWRPYDYVKVYLRRKVSSTWALADWIKESSSWALAVSWHETWVKHKKISRLICINLRYEELSRVNLYLRRAPYGPLLDNSSTHLFLYPLVPDWCCSSTLISDTSRGMKSYGEI